MSHAEPEMNGPEMNEIEAALAAWTPRAPQLDRDRLMFAAGRASSPPPPFSGEWLGEGAAGVGVAIKPTRAPITRHFWPLATCLSTAAAVILAFLLAQQQATVPRDHVAHGATAETKVPSPRDVEKPSPTVSPPLWGGITLPIVSEGTYLALRNRMLTTPVDEWPMPRSVDVDARRGAPDPAVDHQPPTSRNLLREFLPPERPTRQESPNPAESPAAQTTELKEALT